MGYGLENHGPERTVDHPDGVFALAARYHGVYSVEREGQGDPADLLTRSAEFVREALS